jgi:tetraacyldisaccharide 4'-kinase
MDTSRAVAEGVRNAGALVEIGSPGQLADAVRELLTDRAKAAEIGRRAKACAESQRGAAARAAAAIVRLRAEAVPRWLPPLPVRLAAPLYRWGAELKRRATRPRRLNAPVISVGNLSMGGAGKTPLTLHLAERMPGSAILTRGYGRRSNSALILAPGASADWRDTGDEAQLYLRSGAAPLGVGPDRYAVGRAMLEQRSDVQRFLLDDGFQHWRLARDVDLVLIDALDPFPRDRLRESLGALSRASAFVITRADGARPGIERALRERNARAPIFYARMVPTAWVEGATGRRLELLDAGLSRAAAFCGLANPGAFWASLAEVGIRPAARIAFPDHASYGAGEIAALVKRYGKLLTTGKDWVKLGAAAGVYWLETRVEIDPELVRMLLKAQHR